jgi:hypothetical protein
MNHAPPTMGIFSRLGRALFGARARKLHTRSHGAGMRALGRAWATPMTIVFSLGALISLGQKPLVDIINQIQHHQPINWVLLAILAIAFVLVVGMDLTLLNSAMQIADAKARGVKPKDDFYARGAPTRVFLISIVESLTFASVAYQLEQPPAWDKDLIGFFVAWTFILMRAFAAPVCAMFLATLGPRPFLESELYETLKLTIGAALLTKVEQWQFTGEHTFGEMWQVMTLIGRVARAQTDDDREHLSASLMQALEGIAPASEQISIPSPERSQVLAKDQEEDMGEEEKPDRLPPRVRWTRDKARSIQSGLLGQNHEEVQEVEA